jgi:adenine-specific DNA-methyltransferase
LERRRKPGSILVGPYTQSGTKELFDLFGAAVAKFPKPLGLIQELVGIGEDKCATTLDFFAGTGTTGHAIMNLNRSDGGCRKFVLVESSQDFDSVLLPRTKKVTYAPEWKDGKPKRLATAEEAERGPRIVKVVRLESYEDALNNLELRRSEPQQRILDGLDGRVDVRFREQYFLRYMLDVESRGSTSLLNISAFTDPTAYVMSVKRPGSDESRVVNVDLL